MNFGPIHAIFLELSWSQPKLAHSCHGRGQRSNGAINRNKHYFLQKFLAGLLKFGIRGREGRNTVQNKTYPPHTGGYVTNPEQRE